MIFTRPGLVIAGLLVAGCVTMPGEPDGLSGEQRRAYLTATDDWEMRGRIAIEAGPDAYQGRFSWWQAGERSTLLIRGPFGAGSVEISGTPQHMTVRTRNDSWELRDTESELSALLGWWVPVNSLKWWLLGIADQRFPARSRGGTGEILARLEQRAWTLDYASYQLADGVSIPRSIDMRHDSLRLVVTIDAWTATDAQRLN